MSFPVVALALDVDVGIPLTRIFGMACAPAVALVFGIDFGAPVPVARLLWALAGRFGAEAPDFENGIFALCE